MNDEERNGLMKQRRLAREKCKKLQSNWNSLREWLEGEIFKQPTLPFKSVYDILDKMNELEGDNNVY